MQLRDHVYNSQADGVRDSYQKKGAEANITVPCEDSWHGLWKGRHLGVGAV
jgi:hypothetical protein